MKKIRMPKTRAEFEDDLMLAFVAGCNHGYGIDHSINIAKQERLGAYNWVGRISDQEFHRLWSELIEEKQ